VLGQHFASGNQLLLDLRSSRYIGLTHGGCICSVKQRQKAFRGLDTTQSLFSVILTTQVAEIDNRLAWRMTPE
jgi:hypothetical protein